MVRDSWNKPVTSWSTRKSSNQAPTGPKRYGVTDSWSKPSTAYSRRGANAAPTSSSRAAGASAASKRASAARKKAARSTTPARNSPAPGPIPSGYVTGNQLNAQYAAMQAQMNAQAAEQRRQQQIAQQLAQLNSGLAGLGLPPVGKYPTKPLSIPAIKLQEWAEKRAQTARALYEARASRTLEIGNIEDRFKIFQADLGRQVKTDREGAWGDAVDRNLALSPIFINPALKRIRDEQTAALASASKERSSQRQALEQVVGNANRAHVENAASIDRERARIQSELDRLIRL